MATLALFGPENGADTHGLCKFTSVCSPQSLSGGSVTLMTWLFSEPYMVLLARLAAAVWHVSVVVVAEISHIGTSSLSWAV